MATNCTSEDMAPRRGRDEVLGWVAAAIRAERLFHALHEKAEPTGQ
ncbi:MAG: hypothetical protein ACJ735_09300 [Actinomycetes bacterium]